MAQGVFSGDPVWIADPATGLPLLGFRNQTAAGVSVPGLADNADGQAASGTADALKVAARGYVFNGATWDRQRGDTVGTTVVPEPRSNAGGLTQYRRTSTADANVAVVKAGPGRVYGYVFANTSATPRFVKLFNKATAPSLGVDPPVRIIMVPANGIAAYHVGPGLGGFTAGIAIAITNDSADGSGSVIGAGEILAQIDYA